MFRGLGNQNGMYKHGMCRTPIYESWKSMKARCSNPKNPAYKNYGLRGITVCKRWLTFSNFYADMGNPQKGKSLDRKNNNLGYSKKNCRWATPTQQSANSRRVRFVSFKGKKYYITEFCREFGISYATIRTRLSRGWNINKAISQKVRKYDNRISR